MPDKTKEIHINSEIVFREEEEGAFLFDPDTGRICYLNELGVHIWKSCREPQTPERLASEICLNFPEIPKDQIIKDCMKFLEDLGRLGFLVREKEE